MHFIINVLLSVFNKGIIFKKIDSHVNYFGILFYVSNGYNQKKFVSRAIRKVYKPRSGYIRNSRYVLYMINNNKYNILFALNSIISILNNKYIFFLYMSQGFIICTTQTFLHIYLTMYTYYILNINNIVLFTNQ